MASFALLLQQVGQEGNPGPYSVGPAQRWAWIGAACFLVGIVGFSVMGLRATPKGRGHFAPKILVVLTAMTSYLALAFGQGTDRIGETTYFPYARFIDWAITTPLLLLGLALLAVPRARDSLPLILSIMAVDLYMIVTGLFGGLSDEARGVWWVWFIVSSLAFLVLYALIFGPLAQKAKEKVREGDEMRKSDNPVERYLGALHSGEGKWFVPMAGLLALIWLVYPVNFFLDEQGIGVYGHPISDAIYTLADVTAKVVYGFVLLGGILAIERRAADAMGRSPKEMGDEERDRFEAELDRHEGDTARHKLLPVGVGAAEGSGTQTMASGSGSSGGEKVYEADPEGVHVDKDDDDSVRVHRKR